MPCIGNRLLGEVFLTKINIRLLRFEKKFGDAVEPECIIGPLTTYVLLCRDLIGVHIPTKRFKERQDEIFAILGFVEELSVAEE